jgi:hypothetical protein
MKIELLNLMKIVLKKSWKKLSNFTLNWYFYYSELLLMINRENDRYNIHYSVNIFLELRDTLVLFLFRCRHYFNPFDRYPMVSYSPFSFSISSLKGGGNASELKDDISSISTPTAIEEMNLVEYAMKKLSNLRTMISLEGVIALILCLPTSYSLYDHYLSKWFEIWNKIDNNQMWDFCWLLILCRAKKHSSTSHWNRSLLSFLLMKGKCILGILAYNQSESFPKGFPSYYLQVLAKVWNDLDTKMITKYSKLVFHCILYESVHIDKDEGQDKTQPPTQQENSLTCFLGQFFITPPNVISEAIQKGKTTSSTSPSSLIVPLDFPLADDENSTSIFLPAISTDIIEVKSSLSLLCQFFQSIRLYLHPSNNSSSSIYLSRFFEVFIREIVKFYGRKIGKKLISAKFTSNRTVDGSERAHETQKITEEGESVDRITSNTLSYLSGMCFLIVIESMNSTNFTVQALTAMSLTHLLTLNNTYSTLLLPFLLDALSPASITQTHRILAALNIFNHCLHVMLYPNPMIIGYLPEILKLILLNIDISDQQKTMDSLDILVLLFSMIPVRSVSSSSSSSSSSGKEAILSRNKSHDSTTAAVTSLTSSTSTCPFHFPKITNYLQLLNVKNSSISVSSSHQLKQQQQHEEQKTEYVTQLESFEEYLLNEWIYEYFQKIFILIEGLEIGGGEEKKKKGKIEMNDVVLKMLYCNSIILYSCMNSNILSFLTVLEEKILNYILKDASFHVSKVCGKLLASLIFIRKDRLFPLLLRCMDPYHCLPSSFVAAASSLSSPSSAAASASSEVINSSLDIEKFIEQVPLLLEHFLKLSDEKISYHLILMAACFRNGSSGEIIKIFPFICEFLKQGKEAFLYHKENKIRKSYGKVLKEVLRGMTSFYPLNISSFFENISTIDEGMEGNDAMVVESVRDTDGTCTLGEPFLPNPNKVRFLFVLRVNLCRFFFCSFFVSCLIFLPLSFISWSGILQVPQLFPLLSLFSNM